MILKTIRCLRPRILPQICFFRPKSSFWRLYVHTYILSLSGLSQSSPRPSQSSPRASQSSPRASQRLLCLQSALEALLGGVKCSQVPRLRTKSSHSELSRQSRQSRLTLAIPRIPQIGVRNCCSDPTFHARRGPGWREFKTNSLKEHIIIIIIFL